MNKIALTDGEILVQLNRQLKILKHHVVSFSDEPDIALDIATKIRVLCHDTKRQKSLLAQTGKKESIRLLNTYFHKSAEHIKAPFCGLVYVELNFNGARFIPKLNQNPEGVEEKFVEFDEWWNTVILSDYLGNKLTRKDLVLEMADTDGGAHVDQKLRENYHFISRQHSLTWKFHLNKKSGIPVVGVELASVCQIGHELISSLPNDYEALEIKSKGMIGEFSMQGNIGMNMFGKPLPFRMEMSKKSPKGKERNTPCLCGSGKKAKQCCSEGTRVYVTTDPIA